ncbi:SH3 domain-containing protein [Actinacidiphila glaucinigra]|uniref:SH3 domain-containing protein n=1 Tax=Actinacidiphila glaucinigra TaxID=235986 RepID=UPI0033ADD6B9
MKINRSLATLAATAALLVGGSVALAPTASAVGSSACTYNPTDMTFKVNANGLNLRTGPSTGYTSVGLLYKADGYIFKVQCYAAKNQWSYGYLTKKSKSGLAKGRTGWVSSTLITWDPRTSL